VASAVEAQNLNLKNKNYFCISTGLGVDYINTPDVVDYMISISGKKVNEFDKTLELWVSPEFKFKNEVAVKLEYSYITKQYNLEETSTGVPLNYTFTYQLHSPVIILNYLIFQPQEIYIIKIGAGIGFTKGYFEQFLPLANKKVVYQTNGGILKFESVFSSRLDGRIYVYLSADAKLGLSTEAVDEDGNKLIIYKPFKEDRNLRLNFFGVAIRAGFSYYF
jgi:hypothetical protein